MVWVEVAIVGVLIVNVDLQDVIRDRAMGGVGDETCNALTDLSINQKSQSVHGVDYGRIGLALWRAMIVEAFSKRCLEARDIA